MHTYIQLTVLVKVMLNKNTLDAKKARPIAIRSISYLTIASYISAYTHMKLKSDFS